MVPIVKRGSPLDGIVRRGRFGASGHGTPGVTLSIRHPAEIVTVIARKGKNRAVSTALKKHYGLACPKPGEHSTVNGVSLQWCGQDQWYAVADEAGGMDLYNALSNRLKASASVSDQSHGRVIIRISGPKARNVLAKGTPVDLHPDAFGPGRCGVSQIAHIGVHIAQTGPDDFELSLFRGFAESFWDWLTEMAGEFGYEVR